MIRKDVKKSPYWKKQAPLSVLIINIILLLEQKNPVVLIMLYSLQDDRIYPVISSAEFGENGYIPYYLFNKKSNKLYVFYLNRNQTNLDYYNMT